MAFMVSPGVSVSEVDLTTRVPIPSTSVGAFAGIFRWGPVEEITTIVDTNDLIDNFGQTDSYTYASVLTASSFLSYSNNLRVVRVTNTNSNNAVTSSTTMQYSTSRIKNKDEYDKQFSTGISGTDFVARYPGELGNSLKISTCLPDRANFDVTADGEVFLAENTNLTISGQWSALGADSTFTSDADGNAELELEVGDVIQISGGVGGTTTKGIVTSITANNEFSASTYDNGNLSNLGGVSSVPTGSITRFKRSAFEEPEENMFGTLAIAAGSTTVTGTGTFFTYQISPGDILSFYDDTGVTYVRRKVKSVSNNLTLELTHKVDSEVTAATYKREWEFRSSFSGPPTTSSYAYKKTLRTDLNDQIHIIIVDEDGEITGAKDNRGNGTLSSESTLETYAAVSVIPDAVASDNSTIYYKDLINNNSNYLFWSDHSTLGDQSSTIDDAHKIFNGWGADIVANFDYDGTIDNDNIPGIEYFAYRGSRTEIVSGTPVARHSSTFSLQGGTDNFSSVGDGDYMRGFNLFRNPEDIDVSLLMTGHVSSTVGTFVINEICEHRKDCVAFVSPLMSDILTKGSEVSSIVDRRKKLPSSSYAVMDGNFKYTFDRFAGVYRYIPLNGDLAGLCAQSDNQNPYISPAGFTRGNIKNVTKLAYNPNNAERDTLYENGINPVISLPGGGTVLFGDKTLLSRPSAFDRINVRRLFIILEKAIANAAQFSLFEFNDDFTRTSFRSIIEPFLREVQSRRGITDFQVVCDATNNPPNVVDRNEFRGDIFIKPTRSINFINLNFVAIGSGVEFNEVINAI